MKQPGKNAFPRRRCLVARQGGPAAGMIRFVVSPEGALVPDLAGTLPGRGLWVRAEARLFASRQLRQGLMRGARASLAIPDNLAEMVIAGLEKRLVDALGLARKSGVLVSGFEKTRQFLARGKKAAFICAGNASGEERRRLWHPSDVPEKERVREIILPERVMALAFGRENATYAALKMGPLARRIETDSMRLAGMAHSGFRACAEGEVKG